MNHSVKLELFDRLRTNYGGFLKAVLWKLTGERELFAEAMQEALMLIWKNIHKLQADGRGSYIYRIAQSSASKAWRNRTGGNGQIPADFFVQDTSSCPDEKFSEYEQICKVRYAITELPPKQARAIMGRYLEEKDYSSLAAELSCSEPTARSNVSKALAVLQRKLKNE